MRLGVHVQVLRQASQLEVLQVLFERPTLRDLDLLSSLPALRKLVILHEWRAGDPVINATLRLARLALPQVEVSLMADADEDPDEQFIDWARLLLGT